MALPHYKLHALTAKPVFEPGSFPVILVPAEPLPKTERLRTVLHSKTLLTLTGILAALASATLLWFWLDPGSKLPHPKFLWLPAAVLGACFLIFLLAVFLHKGTVDEIPAATIEDTAVLEFPRVVVSPVHEPPQTQLVMRAEQWASEPPADILDDAILAEVFSDELLAPDHLVLCFTVEEKSPAFSYTPQPAPETEEATIEVNEEATIEVNEEEMEPTRQLSLFQ